LIVILPYFLKMSGVE